MSSKLVAETSKEQVAKLEVDRDEQEQSFQLIQQRQHELEVNLKELNDQIPQIETSIQKGSLEIDSLDRNIADAERRIIELTASKQPSKSDDARISALEKQIIQLEKAVEKLRTETAGVEAEIKELQDKIMEVGGVRLRAQKAKVDGLKEQVGTLTEEISNGEVARSKAEKQKVKHQKAFEDAQKEIESAAARVRAVE